MADPEGLPHQSQRAQVNISLSPESSAKLRELAGEAGMRPSTLARLLLDELLPTVASVRTRLQVTRVSANGGRPDNG